MRLHHLEIRAFGPFAGTAEVDFDELSSAGLFLLCGPTGAGKTSVLDAVCFALYGDVPGDRNTAKRLRCDTAPEGRAPRVTLEATLSGRRFRITRSPPWFRPKKRGTGVTTEQASVLVEERVEGEWTALSSRMDEAGHLLTDLVGMTLPQFCQVAMLPQGRFQAFLRARSEERQRLLQQLFRTQRFEDMEKWLRERSRILHRESQAHQSEVALVTSRLLEASGRTAPDHGSLDDLAAAAETGVLAVWAAGLVTGATSELETASEAVSAAQEAERAAATALDGGRRLAELQQRRAEAQESFDALLAEADEIERRRARVEAARRAAPLVPLHKHALASAQQRDRLGEAALTAEIAAAGRVGRTVLTAAELRPHAAESRALLARAEALLPRERDRTDLQAAIAASQAQETALAAERAEVDQRLADLPAGVDGVRRELAEAQLAGAALTAARAEEQRLADRLAAHGRLPGLREDLAEAETLLASAVAECQSLKETWLDLREARLLGMAAEIASGLAVGQSCPVCGSADHPHKATPVPGAPDAAAEKEARSRLDDAEVARTAHEARTRDLATVVALATEQAGDGTADEIRGRLGHASARAATLAADAARVAALQEEAQRLDEELTAARDRAGELTARLAELGERIAADLARLDRVAADVTTLLDGSGFETLADFVEEHRETTELLEQALRARDQHQAATAEALRAKAALDEAVAEHGFDGTEDALAQLLGQDELAALERRVRAHDRALDVANAVLTDPAIAAAAELPPPDLVDLAGMHDDARAALAAAASRHQVVAARATRLGELRDRLTAALESWAPVRAAHAVASELATFVEGKSADNELRMRLSAYVVAWRLGQVVDAANERLLGMSDQRYTLEHSERRGAGETRGGLSMLVRDAWSGEARDPATLSGGETFVVSLALALGLADVVTGEAGGADLDTLFVDEGFGALDADTLDDVMDTLDTLRDGGRVVGVVSHVPELRTRIPTRLQVAKQRGGSTLALVRALD